MFKRSSMYLEVKLKASTTSPGLSRLRKSMYCFRNSIKINQLREEFSLYPTEFQKFVLPNIDIIQEIG